MLKDYHSAVLLILRKIWIKRIFFATNPQPQTLRQLPPNLLQSGAWFSSQSPWTEEFSNKFVHDSVTEVNLSRDSAEFQNVSDHFYLTMPHFNSSGKRINEIKSITRLYYPAERELWISHLRSIMTKQKNQQYKDGIEYVKFLWHGTGNTPPSVIASGGWKINFASNKNLWGRGTYFASNAQYSSTYSYKDSEGNRCMFLAEVIVGSCLQCLENSQLTIAPKGYDSIVGWRHGSWIYVVYDNHVAFPCYLVTWSEKPKK